MKCVHWCTRNGTCGDFSAVVVSTAAYTSEFVSVLSFFYILVISLSRLSMCNGVIYVGSYIARPGEK